MGRTDCAATYLLGVGSVQEFYQFMRLRTLPGAQGTEADWAREWQAAADHYTDLQERESASAKDAVLVPLTGEMEEWSAEELRNPVIQHAYAGLPYQWFW